MPSACVKLDKKSPADTEEAIKQCLSVVEKKVRNLEKRKGKLDSYREQYEKAEDSLNEDQKDAISKYDSVLRNLEFARELQKQFHDINDKAEKLLKKKEKYDKQVKHNEEVARVRELLQVQSTLDNMGVDTVRSDFKSGKRGAVVVSEASLDQLDELYKLISPSRDDVGYMEQLTTASEHIVNLLDGREKEVAGTTYKELKDLISKINQCGYFEKSASEEDSTEETAEQEPEVTEKSEENQTKFEEEVSDAAPATQTAPLTFKDPQLTTSTEQPLPPQVQSMSTAIQDPSTDSYTEQDQDSFFSTVQMGRPRGFQEIVSSVQGSFDFLQESEIEKNKQQKEVPHVDPAVVAAHPMGVHQSDPLSQSYGSAAGFSLDDQTTKSYTPQQQQNVAVSTDQTKSQFDAISAPSVTQSQSSPFAAQNSNFETTQSETWNQRKQETRWSTATDGMERSWGASDQSASQPQKWGDTATPTTSQNTQSWADQAATPNQSWGDQGSQGWSTGGGQRAQLNNNQETKTSSLNPNADIFMYQNQTGNFPQDGRSSNFEGGSRKDDGFSDGFQSQGYRGRRDYDGNRGFRGNRGGPRGNTNSNGYSRGGNRGGYRGGDDRRGGYSDRGNRGGNRGGMRGGPRGGRGRGGGSYNSRPSSAQHQQ